MHGEDALKKKKNRDFSADLKLEIIKRVLNGESKSSVAIEYNIEPSQIRLWLKNIMKMVIMVLSINRRKEDHQP